MHLLTNSDRIPDALKGAVVAIGNFDGVHRGHQKLLEAAKDLAEARNRPWGVVTFEPHPRTFFKPSEPVFRLTPAPLKTRLIAALGATFTALLAFDRKLSELEPREFINRHLVSRLAVSHVVSGYDFHFGRGRKGNPQILIELGKELGFGVTVVDQVTDEGDIHSPFSSSSIRRALRHGHMADAAHELGYYWTVMGEVVPGDQRGRAIGFPTVNIVLDPGADPFRGIYAVRVRDAAAKGAKAWSGAGYFGDRPTFDSDRTFVEAYLIDHSADLYGRTLLVEFINMIRPDRRFHSVAELVEQMRKDCNAASAHHRVLEQNNPLAEFPLGRMQEQGLI